MKESIEVTFVNRKYEIPEITQLTVLTGNDVVVSVMSEMIAVMRQSMAIFNVFKIVEQATGKIDDERYKSVMETYLKETYIEQFGSLTLYVKYRFGSSEISAKFIFMQTEAFMEKRYVCDSFYANIDLSDSSYILCKENNFNVVFHAYLNSTRERADEEISSFENNVLQDFIYVEKGSMFKPEMIQNNFKNLFVSCFNPHIEAQFDFRRQVSYYNNLISSYFEVNPEAGYIAEPRVLITTQSPYILEQTNFYIVTGTIKADEVKVYSLGTEDMSVKGKQVELLMKKDGYLIEEGNGLVSILPKVISNGIDNLKKINFDIERYLNRRN